MLSLLIAVHAIRKLSGLTTLYSTRILEAMSTPNRTCRIACYCAVTANSPAASTNRFADQLRPGGVDFRHDNWQAGAMPPFIVPLPMLVLEVRTPQAARGDNDRITRRRRGNPLPGPAVSGRGDGNRACDHDGPATTWIHWWDRPSVPARPSDHRGLR